MTDESRLQRLFGRPSPLLKQMPSLAAMLIAWGLTLSVAEMQISSHWLVSMGVLLVFFATLYAAWLSSRGRYEGFIVMLIPMADIIAFGLFRTGTGGTSSLFGSLLLIPVVWLAAAPGIRYVVFVAVLSSFNYSIQFFTDPPTSSVEWVRVIVAPLVFAVVAAVINELSRQQRRRTEQAEQLLDERTQAIKQNEQMIQRLNESRKEYRALLESFESLWSSITAQAIFATDTAGKVQAWTPGAENLFGLTVQQALDTVTIERFFPQSVLDTLASDRPADCELAGSESLPEGIRALFAATDATSTFETNLEVNTATGVTVPARVTVTQRRDGDGKHLGYLLVITDETRAAEVARMKDEFVGMVSHELRTPLSSILGFLDLLQNDPEQPLSEDQQEFVDVIERNANRLLALVGDLLFTAQVEAGSFPLALREVDLNESVAAAVRSAQPNAVRGEVEVIEKLGDEPLIVTADPVRIGQAVDNLLSNAIKFTPSGGKVTVGARPLDGAVEIWVRDTGLGIPKAEQDKLFTRFFRASTATRNAVPGIGLGLTIIRAIVLAHGGTMSVTSGEGEGTEFRVTVPLVAVAR
ncbi:MAG: PAS domain-containing protein [Actinobacteria bacterium]|nr:PAS domain-containing protein [Actinomycetota bacterium]